MELSSVHEFLCYFLFLRKESKRKDLPSLSIHSKIRLRSFKKNLPINCSISHNPAKSRKPTQRRKPLLKASRTHLTFVLAGAAHHTSQQRSTCRFESNFITTKSIIMGTFSKGILGGFSGKVGPVVGSSWKGIDVMRSMPNKKKGTSSVAQLDQQLKFSIGMQFMQPMTELVNVTFNNYATDQTAFNAAFSYTLKNAIAGKTPDYVIDYSKALLSKGTLPNATAPAASATNKAVFFTWTDNSGIGNAAATDSAIMVIYCKELNAAIFTWKGGMRSDSAAQLDVSGFTGKTVATWLGFLSANGSDVADSIYTGEVLVK